VLTNAVYFKGSWSDQFKKRATKPAKFHLEGADPVDVQTMHQTEDHGYFEDDDGTIHIGRDALRKAMAATSGFQGLTGLMDCGTKEFAAGTSNGDCATGEALGIFQLTSAEVDDENWPPEAIYTP